MRSYSVDEIKMVIIALEAIDSRNSTPLKKKTELDNAYNVWFQDCIDLLKEIFLQSN